MTVVFVLVLVAVLGLFAGAHRYLWQRLVRDVSIPGSVWRRTGTVLAFALPALVVVNFVTSRSGVPFTVTQVLAWPGYMWLALLLYLLLALLAGELVRPLLRRLLARRDARKPSRTGVSADAPPVLVGSGSADDAPSSGATEATGDRTETTGTSRRLFIARTVGAGAALAAAGTVGAGTYGTLNGPTLKRVTVPLAKLPRAAHGYRIAVVSDIHLGPILGRAHTQRIVDTINSAQPDLVAVVGDLVDGTVADLGPAAEPLRNLRSRHGSFFVTGNHEYFGDAGEWVDHLRELDVHPLENARRELPGFDLAGVNDVQGEESGDGPDFRRALGDRDTSRASVLLAHQPVQIHEAVRHGVDLQLSGHSHGGQLWPGEYLAALGNPTVAGLERYGDTQLYVTRGAGAWGPPVRVGAESDVTVIRLASKQA